MFIIVAGPESSGTRIFTKAIASHPDIVGSDGSHSDYFDSAWKGGEFPDVKNGVTRRSYPHGKDGGVAKYCDYESMHGIINSAKKSHDVIVLIPVRAVYPHLASWTMNRASVKGEFQKACFQYQSAYQFILSQCHFTNTPFWFLSLEALNDDYMETLFDLCGLAPFRPGISYNGSDDKHYEHFKLLRTADSNRKLA